MAGDRWFSEEELKILLALAEEEEEYVLQEESELVLPGTSSPSAIGIKFETKRASDPNEIKAHHLAILSKIIEKLGSILEKIKEEKEKEKQRLQ